MIRRWFLAGLLVWIPLGATLLVIRFLYDLLNSSAILVPLRFRSIFPGVGVALSVILVLGTGALAANFLGRKLVEWAEGLLNRVPLVRTVYSGVKRLAETLFLPSSSSFRKVVWIEYPRKGIWSVGFQAGTSLREVEEKTGHEYITVFIPMTPIPTSGFIMQIPRDEVLWSSMTIEEGMRYIISLGVVPPDMSLDETGRETSPSEPGTISRPSPRP